MSFWEFRGLGSFLYGSGYWFCSLVVVGQVVWIRVQGVRFWFRGWCRFGCSRFVVVCCSCCCSCGCDSVLLATPFIQFLVLPTFDSELFVPTTTDVADTEVGIITKLIPRRPL